MNAAGTETYYDKPGVVEALQYWVDLTNKYKVQPEGIIDWGTTPKDFFERKVAMMWTTTGNLTNVKNNAKFDFGVAMLPANKRRGSPTGGGNFYVFKQAKPEQQAAALKFIKWITSPARAAQWGIDTGYVAVRPDAWETPAMKKYVAEFPPAAVARDQLQYAVAELSTHDNQRVTKALNDGLQAALTGTKPAAPGDGRRAARSRAPAASLSEIGRAALRDAEAAFVRRAASACPAGDRASHDANGDVALRLAAASAGSGIARAVHAFSGGRDAVAQLPVDAEGCATGGIRRHRQLSATRRRPDFLEGADQQSVVRRRNDSAGDRARAADGGLGQRASWQGAGSCGSRISRRQCCR